MLRSQDRGVATYTFSAQNPCERKVILRVDDRFSIDERRLITKAASAWSQAAKGRICFKLVDVEVGVIEAANYMIDMRSTIYSGRYAWQPLAAILLHGCLVHEGCLGVTVGYKNLKSPDIFILVRERLLNLFTHEIGHALGLPHSPNRGDIMFEQIRKKGGISKRDISVLNCLIKIGLPMEVNEKVCRYEE